MIGMHHQLFGFPELSLFRAEKIGDVLENPPGFRGFPAIARTAGLARALAQLHEGSQSDEAVTRAREWLRARSGWPTVDVFDHLFDCVSPAIAVEKSPENSSREDFLSRMVDSYPRARFVHLTRHPVTTVKSMARAWGGLGFWDVPDELFHLHLLGIWLFSHARIIRLTDSLPPDRWLRIRSEDVLGRPVEVLPELCRWLGVDDGPDAVDMMLHPERSPFARLGPPSGSGGNDPGFLESPHPRAVAAPESVEFPKEWTADPWFLLAVIQMAAALGYGRRPQRADALPTADAGTPAPSP
jgi:hypothetical protein